MTHFIPHVMPDGAVTSSIAPFDGANAGTNAGVGIDPLALSAARHIAAAFDRFLWDAALGPDALSAVHKASTFAVRHLRYRIGPGHPPLAFTNTLLGGSVGRGTALRDSSADLFVWLTEECAYAPTTDRALDRLATTAAGVGLSPDARQARTARRIAITVMDQRLRLVPVRDLGSRLYIPGANGQWIPFDPMAEAVARRQMTQVYGDAPRQLALMLKSWVRRHHITLSGFAADLLVQYFFEIGAADDCVEPADLFEAFADWAITATPLILPLPGGVHRLRVAPPWWDTLRGSQWRMAQARRAVADGDAVDASRHWRHLLGDVFPDLALSEAA